MKPCIENKEYQMNAAYYEGNLSDILGDMINSHIEMECECFDVEPEDWEVDYKSLFDSMVKEAVDIIEEELVDVYDYLKVCYSLDKPNASTDLFSRPDYLPFTIEVLDAQGLIKHWRKEFEKEEVNDGRNISGFVRTADDDVWSLHMILVDLLEDANNEIFSKLLENGSDCLNEYIWPTNE
ncbi:MAG: hypothetical protein E7B29_13025 [Mixta calida]|nr:hypothetical protein [Mixta calida]